jgi:hypothetical protein
MHRGVYSTDAGMHCVWDQTAFAHVDGYDAWSKELENDSDILRHIREGEFVPLNLNSDGAMEIDIRAGIADDRAKLNEREGKYLIVGSEPYRLRSTGQIGVSGIESVEVPPGRDAGSFDLPAGEYEVRVHLIGWDEEPGMQTENGPAPGALPDYIVLINPARPGAKFRTELKTFD